MKMTLWAVRSKNTLTVQLPQTKCSVYVLDANFGVSSVEMNGFKFGAADIQYGELQYSETTNKKKPMKQANVVEWLKH